MQFVVDRFEGEYVILEDIDTREIREVLRNVLPSSIHEGVILDFDGENYSVNQNATNDRRWKILLKFESLKNNTD